MPQQPMATPPHYRIVDIGATPGVAITSVSDIRNNGDIFGGATFAGASAGFVSQGEQPSRLSVPYGQLDETYGPFPAGPLYVWYGTVTLPAGGTRCVSWGSKGGSYFVSDLIQCVGANEIGEVAGYRIGDSGYPQAVVIRQGVRTDLGTLGGQWSRATAINNGGQILGSSQTPSGEGRPFLWSNGAMTPLSSLPSGATATAINDRGQVVGHLPTSGYTGRMFIWQNGSHRFLPSLNPLGESPIDINLYGQIIGSGSAGPVLWQNEQAYLLNGLIDAEDPLRLVTRIRSVRAINDFGQIVGFATINGVDRPVRLDPVLPK